MAAEEFSIEELDLMDLRLPRFIALFEKHGETGPASIAKAVQRAVNAEIAERRTGVPT